MFGTKYFGNLVLLVYGYLNITTLIGYDVFFPKTLLYPIKALIILKIISAKYVKALIYNEAFFRLDLCSASDGSLV